MKILARPYKNTAEPGQGVVYDQMVANGHLVEEFSFRRLLTQRYDIVHIHYPEAVLRRPKLLPSLLGAALMIGVLALCRVRKMKVVGTGHNARSHESYHPLLERFVVGAFDRSASAMTFPSETAAEVVTLLRPRLAGTAQCLVPLVNYQFERSVVSRNEARSEWGLSQDSSVVLYLGLIRPYKNVPALIKVARQLGRPDVQFVIAGNPANDEMAHQVQAAAASDPNIRLVLRYIETEEVSSLMAASDLVALPFSAVLNSGSTLLAVSHHRPVLVPRTGALGELARRAGEEWFHFYDGDLSLSHLEQALATVGPRSPADLRTGPDLSWCDLDEVVRLTTEFYESLLFD